MRKAVTPTGAKSPRSRRTWRQLSPQATLSLPPDLAPASASATLTEGRAAAGLTQDSASRAWKDSRGRQSQSAATQQTEDARNTGVPGATLTLTPHVPDHATISEAPPSPAGTAPAPPSPASTAPAARPTSRPASAGSRSARFLGEGAFGRVYEAYDPQLDARCRPEGRQARTADHARPVERFLREARAAADLPPPDTSCRSSTPVPTVPHFIACAFIAGRTLSRAGERGPSRPPDLRHAAELLRKLAEALAYAHGKGIVHRDVKPANVMLDERGRTAADGLRPGGAGEGEERLTQEGSVLGTPAYMAPEQAAGKVSEVGPASDQYSLGCMLYELLTGQTPFGGPPEIRRLFLHIDQEPPSPRTLDPEAAARPGDDLPEVPGEGAGAALRRLPGAGRRPAPLARRRADLGPAHHAAGAGHPLVPAPSRGGDAAGLRPAHICDRATRPDFLPEPVDAEPVSRRRRPRVVAQTQEFFGLLQQVQQWNIATPPGMDLGGHERTGAGRETADGSRASG